MVAALLLDVTVVFVLYPYLVRLLSRARPVTDPAVLSMLDELNRTCGTSVDRLWLLSSPTGSLNAMVTGVSRRRPTIFVTDALLASFSLADLRAILAHELAHVRRRHILRALGNSWMGVVVYMGLFMLVWTVVSKVSGQTPGPLAVAAMVFVASLVTDLGVWLPLGRRRESEADQLAASWVGGEALAGALERLYGANLAAADFSLTEKIWASHPTLRTRLSQLNRG
jgi:STE24 endopeptidase